MQMRDRYPELPGVWKDRQEGRTGDIGNPLTGRGLCALTGAPPDAFTCAIRLGRPRIVTTTHRYATGQEFRHP